MKKYERTLRREAQRHGVELRRTKRHLQFVDCDGRVLVTTASTPSDWRGHRNLMADLRRALTNKPKE